MRIGNIARGGAANLSELASKESNRFAFFILLSYLFLEYGRPQALIPPLRVLHLSAVTAVLLALSLFTRAKLQFQDKQTMRYVFLLGLMVVHGPIAENNYWTLMIFIAMCYHFIVFLSLLYFVDDEKRFAKLVDVWILIHVMVAAVGIAFKGKGAGGFLGDENDLCLTLNMVLPFPFFLGMAARTTGKKLYYIGLSCLFLFVIILTKSRGGFVGLAATGVFCWWKSKRKLLSATVIVGLVLFMLVAAPSSYWDEIRSITQETEESNPYGTGSARFHQWHIAWKMFLRHPIMGVGQGNFPWNIINFEDEVGLFHQRSMAGREAHSLYFTLIPELGLIGIFLFVSMIFAAIKDMKYIQHWVAEKTDNGVPVSSIGLALEASLIAYLSSGVFLSVLYYPNVWILMGFCLALRKILERKRGIAGEPRAAGKPVWRPPPAALRKDSGGPGVAG